MDGHKKKLIAGIITLIVGVAVCVAGLVFMLTRLNTAPVMRDAEYLVEVGKWARNGEPGVIWEFTEVGKGKLTTNNHVNDYDFIWAISGDKIEIETDWLYTLNDAYEYAIDQTANSLTLTSADKTISFSPVAATED